jgi:hypothetical protein
MLEARGQRSVRYLDREEFEGVFVIGAGDAVSAQQRLSPTFSPIMVNSPFRNRNEGSRVVVKLNSVSVQ